MEIEVGSSHQACKLTWKNLNYTVKVKDKSGMKDLEVIKDVSGFALPGQATFIMGSSGAGKTSLLNIIADRIALK